MAAVGVLSLILAACGVGQTIPATTSRALPVVATHHGGGNEPTTTTTTTTTLPAITTTTLPPLGSPGPGLLAGHVTAIGDSVMIDAEPDLKSDIPGIDVEALVSFQFYEGISLVQTLRAEHRLGAIIVIGLGTNGPFSDTQFDEMMSACSGASRVVFITTHVGQPWQDQVNAALAAGVARYPKVAVLADWAALAAQHPEWFYSDGTHMPIGGPGAQALAALVASKV
ncbi:MAG TPA: hypothetical protein VK217_01505 [Acidimicrobiales bacterium]|nr:hypothetical protein [Acidimicrobiales bacterium]